MTLLLMTWWTGICGIRARGYISENQIL